MAVDFPDELTKKYWDKKKPTLAKSKKTGIGEALDDLETAHGKIKWTNFTANDMISSVDLKLKEWPDTFKAVIQPVADEADEVMKLTKKWAADFKKDKLMPKSASELCQEISDAAREFYTKLTDFEGEQALVYVEQRKKAMAHAKKMMVTALGNALKKSDLLIKDIANFAKDPTETNFWVYFKGDCNARGFTTGCKNWDQLMAEFPEIRDQCYTGSAMKDFFPCMQDYGANYDAKKFETTVNGKRKETGDELWKWHASHLEKSIPTVKEFQKVLAKGLKLVM